MTFHPGQDVTLEFTDGTSILAQIVSKVDDAKITPLTDFWFVRVVCEGGLGRAFGFPGKAIFA